MSDVGARDDALSRIGHQWPELAVLLVGQTLASLTTAVISVAAPAVSHYLGLTGGNLQIVVSGYGLTYTALLVTGARLGDRGYRRMFLLGVALFTVAGLISGLAPGVATLTIGQLMQGAGAALLIPQVLTLIQLRFTGPARSKAVSLYSMTLGFGVALGLILGGILVGTNIAGLAWRPVFLVNVPIGVALLAVGWWWLPRDSQIRRSRVDVRGVLVFTLAIALVVVALAFGPSTGWPQWTWLVIAAGIAAFAAFVVLEQRLAPGESLLDFRVLQQPGVTPGLVVIVALMGGYGTLLYTMSAYLQSGLGYSVLEAGLIFAAYAVGFGSINLTWSRLPRFIHRWVSPTGTAVLLAAEVALGSVLGSSINLGVVLPLLVIAGIGHGSGFGALVDRVTAHVPEHHSSALSGLINTVTQLSILIGIAALGGFYLSAARSGGQGGYNSAISAVCFALAAATGIALACTLTVSTRLADTGSGSRPLGH